MKDLIDDYNINIDISRKFSEMYYAYKLLKNVILFEQNLKLFCFIEVYTNTYNIKINHRQS
jgi:hypothetical protein